MSIEKKYCEPYKSSQLDVMAVKVAGDKAGVSIVASATRASNINHQDLKPAARNGLTNGRCLSSHKIIP
jgi:hypothetical protein